MISFYETKLQSNELFNVKNSAYNAKMWPELRDKKYYNDLDLNDFFKLKIPRLFLFAKQVGKNRKRFDLSENHADPSHSSPCETDWKKRENF